MDVKHLIKESSPFYLVIFTLICSLILNLFVMGIFYVFNLGDVLFTEKTQESIGMLEAFNIIFTAPLVETFIFQAIPFYFLMLFSFFKEKKILIAIISAIIFASCHHDTLIRIITTFLCGFLLITIFILREKNKGFWIVCVTHAIWNTFAVVLVKLMEYFKI